MQNAKCKMQNAKFLFIFWKVRLFFLKLNRKRTKMTENKPFDIKKRSFQFALNCLKYCKHISNEHKEYILTKQLSRSATSVGANIREAQNAVSKKDFVHKLTISQKECNESIYWIELLSAFLELKSSEIKSKSNAWKKKQTNYYLFSVRLLLNQSKE